MERRAADSLIGTAEYARPYAWWGYHWSAPVPMSIVEIVDAGTLHRRVAAVLWLLVEARRSIVLASDPPMSGKTTLLSALLPFLPADTRVVFLRGLAETFDYARDGDPRTTYLLVNELSGHLPVYLWGRKAAQMFRSLHEGYGVGTTMHADDSASALAQLRDELGIGADELGCLDVVGIIRVFHGRTAVRGHDDIPPELRYGRENVVRRLTSAHLVIRRGDEVVTPPFSEWDPATDEHRLALEPILDELARRTGRTVDAFCAELARRERFLDDLARRAIRRPRAVADAIATYAQDPTGGEGHE